MGKISKYSNIYNTNGELIRKIDTKGILEAVTLKEVQDLVDKLGTEKDEYGNIKDPVGFNNASYILMQMYNNPKYNDEKENFIRDLNDRLRVNKEEVREALVRDVENEEKFSKGESLKSYDVNDNKEEYVEYEEG